jgi:hypothetical protein
VRFTAVRMVARPGLSAHRHREARKSTLSHAAE